MGIASWRPRANARFYPNAFESRRCPRGHQAWQVRQLGGLVLDALCMDLFFACADGNVQLGGEFVYDALLVDEALLLRKAVLEVYPEVLALKGLLQFVA